MQTMVPRLGAHDFRQRSNFCIHPLSVEPNEDLFDDASDDVVVVGLGDLGAVEGAGDELFVGAEVVDEDLAVDLGGVDEGAALPEEFRLFGLAFDEEVNLAADPAFGLVQIFCWSFISLRRRDSMVRLGTLFVVQLKACAPSSSE